MSVIATINDLNEHILICGDAAHNASAAIRKLFDDLNRFNRYFVHENKMWMKSWILYKNPNNRRKMSGKPMVRLRAHEKAYRNERR